MLFVRKIGKIVRGNATPTQLMLACIFGGMIGFLPDFSNSAGLTIFLCLLLFIFNSNIGLALIILGLGKLLSLLIVPVSFKVGFFLIEKLATPIFSFLINAPVTAFFGFEYYVTTGGLFLGLIFGLIIGFFILKFLKTFRNSMAKAEGNSTQFINYSKVWWGKLLLWVFFGPKSKEDFSKIIEKKGKSIRIAGVVFVIIFILLFFATEKFFAGTFIKNSLKTTLEQLNGATVDIKNASLNLSESKFSITGLAITDPENLQTNSFSAEKIVADISSTDLLRKKMRLDNLEILNGEIGGERKTMGKIFKSTKNDEEKSNINLNDLDGEKIENYLSNAKEIKAKLKKWKTIYEKFSTNAKKVGEFVEKDGESLKEQLLRKAKLLGFNNVKADHLIKRAPLFAITNLKANNVKAYKFLESETLEITAKEITTHPLLSSIAPQFSIQSSKDTFMCKGKLAGLSSNKRINSIEFRKNKIPADPILKNLKIKDEQTFKGGNLNITSKGEIFDNKGPNIDFPLNVTIENTIMTIPKLGSKNVESLNFTVYVKGEMDNPNVKVDTEKLTNQLKAIWKGVLKEKVQEEKDKLENKAKDKIKEKYGDKASGLLDGILKKKKKKK